MRLELKQEKAINEHLRDELKKLETRKDEQLGELASELGNVQAINKRLESELERARGELKEGERAISMLQTQLDKKDEALATLQAQSQQQLQLTLPLVTDSLDSALEQLQSEKSEILEEQTPAGKVEPSTITNQAAPSMNPEPETVTSDWVEVGRGELMEYIYKRFPGAEAEIKAQNITDAINGKSKRMPEFEEKYRFKHIGKKAGQHRFKIPENY